MIYIFMLMKMERFFQSQRRILEYLEKVLLIETGDRYDS